VSLGTGNTMPNGEQHAQWSRMMPASTLVWCLARLIRAKQADWSDCGDRGQQLASEPIAGWTIFISTILGWRWDPFNLSSDPATSGRKERVWFVSCSAAYQLSGLQAVERPRVEF